MKMVRYYKSGEPEVLQIEEVAIPQPEAGQVLIKVEAIDVGFVDTQMRNEGSHDHDQQSFHLAANSQY